MKFNYDCGMLCDFMMGSTRMGLNWWMINDGNYDWRTDAYSMIHDSLMTVTDAFSWVPMMVSNQTLHSIPDLVNLDLGKNLSNKQPQQPLTITLSNHSPSSERSLIRNQPQAASVIIHSIMMTNVLLPSVWWIHTKNQGTAREGFIISLFLHFFSGFLH